MSVLAQIVNNNGDFSDILRINKFTKWPYSLDICPAVSGTHSNAVIMLK